MDHTISSAVELFKSTSDIFKQAQLTQFLYREKQLRLNEISRLTNVNPSYLSQILPVLDLPEYVLDGYYGNQIHNTHIRLLARLGSEQDVQHAYREILENKLSTSKTEELIRRLLHHVSPSSISISPKELTEFENKLSEKLDAKVTIKQSKIEARIQIKIKGNTEISTKILREVIDKLLEEEFDLESEIERHLIVLE